MSNIKMAELNRFTYDEWCGYGGCIKFVDGTSPFIAYLEHEDDEWCADVIVCAIEDSDGNAKPRGASLVINTIDEEGYAMVYERDFDSIEVINEIVAEIPFNVNQAVLLKIAQKFGLECTSL